MTDLVNKRCVHTGCDKAPAYGPRGGQALYCKPHIPEDVAADYVHVSHEKAAIRELCAAEGCNVKRRFGRSKEGPTLCAAHKGELGDDEIDFGVKCVNHRHRLASHGERGTVLMTHCRTCADDNLVDLRAMHRKNGRGVPKERRLMYV
jgi:hypothetical protein